MNMNAQINQHVITALDGRKFIMPYTHDRITDLMALMKEVVYGKELSNGKLPIALKKHMASIYRYSQLYSNGYVFSPLLEFFFDQYGKHLIQQYGMDLDMHDPPHITLFMDFVSTMRNNAVATKLKKKVDDRNSKFNKSEERLVAFEKEIFEIHGRLMVVRLDLNHKKARFTLSEIEQIHHEALLRREHIQPASVAEQDVTAHTVLEGRVTLEEVQKDRERFFRNMKGKPSLFKYLVGFVWRIEFTKQAGYHMHVTLFFNGTDVKAHAYYAQKIGEYWQDVITKGRGYFENCNLERDRYKDRWALGEVNHWDRAKRLNLTNMLTYFCKTNQVVQVVPYKGCHLFGCGFVRRRRKVQGGRPRSKAIVEANHQGA